MECAGANSQNCTNIKYNKTKINLSLRVLSKPGGEVKAIDYGEDLRELVGSGRTSLWRKIGFRVEASASSQS